MGGKSNGALQAAKVSTCTVSDHVRWTAAITTSALLGHASFFKETEFQELSRGFSETMKDQLEWAQVRQLVSPVHPHNTEQQPRLQIHYLGVLGWLYGYQTPGSAESRICGHCKKSPLKHVLPPLPVPPQLSLRRLHFVLSKNI